MRTFRVLVLLLVAVLLPVRVAIGAAMLCSGGGMELKHGAAAAATDEPSAHGAPAHGDSAHAPVHEGHHGMHGHGHGAPADAVQADTGSVPSDGFAKVKCHVCITGGSATPLLAVPPEIAAPALTAEVDYPALVVPVPSFQGEGQERPPRTV
ncbi:MAG: hypothetical protein KF788_09075 [Piscinibacter sp.]|nr:hypothetical protein [Piscinibacter sp.]